MLYPVVELIRLFLTRIISNKNPFIGDEIIYITFHKIFEKVWNCCCNLLVVLPLALDQLLNLNLWFIILVFLMLYSFFIILVKKKNKLAK